MTKQVHLIGSSGFVGKAIQDAFFGPELVCWSHTVNPTTHLFDLKKEETWVSLFEMRPDYVIILSWPGLPNYKSLFHITEILPLQVKFVESLVSLGCKKIVFAGTCYEYGMLNGSLTESLITNPVNNYAIAKDALRKSLASICKNKTALCWLRIFYPYGIHQNPKSLYPSLIRAISNNDPYFPMSSGSQVRDFISIDEVARFFIRSIMTDNISGVFNIGSGHPVSLREFAESILSQYDCCTKLKLGVFPDRHDEPFAFWADMTKTNTTLMPISSN